MKTTRQRTRVIALVHSHSGDQINVSPDCIYLSTQKTTKQTGRWQIHLVPRKNYMNLIFPNDVMNIYIDPGDGKRGFIRTMMGYVDRVERTETTDANTGATTTRIVVIGSDFQKAMDKTSLYFNGFMRGILDARFAKTDDGRTRTSGVDTSAKGAASRNAGLTAFGTPADFIESTLQTILGFAGQWSLPEGYSFNRSGIALNRRKRVQRSMARLPQNILELLTKIGINQELLSLNVDNVIKRANEVIAEGEKATEAEKAVKDSAERRAAAQRLTGNPPLLAFRSALETTDLAYPTGLLDLLSFDTVEAAAIDGYNANASILQQQGALSQFLYGNSNDIVNELIFDLRPVSAGPLDNDGGLKTGPYSQQPDELGINVEGVSGFEASVHGVKYVPSVVFREYPYSVVPGFDTSGIHILPPGEGKKQDVGFLPFGPVFGLNPNVPGRHIFEYDEKLTLTDCEFFVDHKPLKHIDVVVIKNSDVVAANVGRSDEDLFNVFHLNGRSSDKLNEQNRGIMSNFSPVINQISVARNGIRLWEGNTTFAAYGDGSCVGVGGDVDSKLERANLVRWSLLLDHWYQHNAEFLSGSITLRGMPEIRVGYRLDWEDRSESYYVEAVTNTWQYPNALQTQVSVSRGQRNDPFPVYIPPVFSNESNTVLSQSSGDRSSEGRLANFFKVRDTQATLHSTERTGVHNEGTNDTDEIETTKSGIVIKSNVVSGTNTNEEIL